MTCDCCHILAADEGIWGLVPIIAVLVLGAIGWVLSKAKEKHDQEQAKRMEEEEYEQEHRARHGGPAQPQASERREPTSAQQVMTVLRQALTGEQPAAPTKRPPPPPAGQQRRPPKRPAQAVKRGEGPGEARVATRRPGGRSRKLGSLAAAQAPSPETPTPPALALQLNLGDRDAAARGIVYAEVLGPPKALRRGPEIWDA